MDLDKPIRQKIGESENDYIKRVRKYEMDKAIAENTFNDSYMEKKRLYIMDKGIAEYNYSRETIPKLRKKENERIKKENERHINNNPDFPTKTVIIGTGVFILVFALSFFTAIAVRKDKLRQK